MPRFYCPTTLQTDVQLALPPSAARHVQVLRMQPGMAITLFNGEGGEFDAQILQMGKRDVQVQIGAHHAIEREAVRSVHLMVGMPANERMDWLVEKATELGVTRITPLMTQHSVLRLQGERADKKRAHWQDIAASACEQCGRNRVPLIDAPHTFADGLLSLQAHPAAQTAAARWVLSLHAQSQAASEQTLAQETIILSGPEGGLSDAEDAAARAAGFAPVTLGQRVLRAETAALAALVCATLR